MSIVSGLIDFINASPTPYHAVANIKKRLLAEGFSELYENERFELTLGGKYFVIRGGTSIIAFVYNGKCGFNLVATHSDSPTFRLKRSLTKVGAYTRLDTEKYGGAINYTWFDRPLGIAGRVITRTEDGVRPVLVDLPTTVVIPSVAPHLDREVNQKFAPNPAVDLLPLYSISLSADALLGELSGKAGVDAADILAYDLQLYAKSPAMLIGADEELILAPRLDNLEGAYASLLGFLDSRADTINPVYAVFDNEEVGSSTREGAASTFLYDVLSRIMPDREDYISAVSNGFMLSLDNAHAQHPAHPEYTDAGNYSLLGGGVTVKFNANHAYTTDGMSEAIFRYIADKAGVTVQPYANRADKQGGSTLGSIASTKVPFLSVDIGMPMLAMHSSTETAAAFDLDEAVKVAKAFYNTKITSVEGGYNL